MVSFVQREIRVVISMQRSVVIGSGRVGVVSFQLRDRSWERGTRSEIRDG